MIEFITKNWEIVSGLVVGAYELIVRFIPTVKSYSVIAKIIDVIKWVSDYFDKKK